MGTVGPGALVRSLTFRSKELCENCQKLDLSVDKFLIESSGLARSLKDSMPIPNKKVTGMRLNSGLGKQCLGTIQDLNQRGRECSLCWLVISAVVRYSVEAGADVSDASKCYMVWEVDGRRYRTSQSSEPEENHEQYENVSRRIRFWWRQEDGKVMEAYILFVSPYDQDDGDTMRPGKQQRRPAFLAKPFAAQMSKHSIIRDWISMCDSRHSVCKLSETAETKDTSLQQRLAHLIQQTSFGVIDVLRMRLCRLPGWDTPYVALSYVWGQGNDSHRTRRENVVKRTQLGGIEEGDLPKTIQDAIQLTRDLGFRYIWIDSLCIVQDSESSFRLNAANMDLVYGNASLTICAADGVDANEGLVALNPELAEVPLRAEYSKGIRLQVARPSESVIRDSVWDRRAWTFQERILSRRCLVFSGKRVYFQCRSSNMSEDVHRDSTGMGLSMDTTSSPLRTLREMEPRPIWFYMTCVSLYTGRHLTYAKDMIPAFEGVSCFMQSRMHGSTARFVHGLPPSHFDLALLWEPLGAQQRRRSSGNELAESDLPSWSWAGWMDAAVDAEHMQRGSPVRYKKETLEGCFNDVHEWLRDHTWINWFIRNSDGDLRPLWHKDFASEVEGQKPLPRWRGYAVQPILPDSEYEDAKATKAPHSEDSISIRDIEDGGPEDIYHDRSEDEDQGGRAEEDKLAPGETFYERHVTIRRKAVVRHDAEPKYLNAADRNRSPKPHHYRESHGPMAQSSNDRRAANEYLHHRRSDHRSLSPSSRASLATDDYGRRPNPPVPSRRPFKHVIPDNPFGVKEVKFETRPHQPPDQTILQFFTWEAHFHVLQRKHSNEQGSQDEDEKGNEADRPGNGLVRCDIADENKDWCGHIVLNEDWVANHQDGEKSRFIAMSEAKSFTKVECPNWAHYIPRDLEEVEWDLVFVLLIELNPSRLVWERVGLGKVFRAAFNLTPRWEEVLLG